MGQGYDKKKGFQLIDSPYGAKQQQKDSFNYKIAPTGQNDDKKTGFSINR